MRAVREGERGDGRPPRRAQPSLWLWALGGLVAVGLVVGAVAGALREPASLDPRSPEGVVQAYLQAVIDGDYARAREALSADTAARCSDGDFRQVWVPESLTGVLEHVETGEDQAEVRVRIRSVVTPGPFGGDGFEALETFRLRQEDGRWRLVGEPWPLIGCRGA